MIRRNAAQYRQINKHTPAKNESQPNFALAVTSTKPESPINTCKFCPLTPERFHVLLNSLFKVLFNFPSRYLFAIGLVVIFSLRWSLPPDLGCTPKQPDSTDKTHCTTRLSYGPSTLHGRWPRSRGTWIAITYRQCLVPNATFLGTRGIPDSALGSSLFARRY